jgi:Protein of unknown function (DUF4019)
MGLVKRLNSGMLLSVVLLWGCSAPVDIGAASGAGKKFHDEFNQQNYDKMYQEADPKFRSVLQPDAWSKLMTRVHDKLGNVTDATRTGFNVNYNVGGSTVTITYATKFQLGEGQEEFVWLKSNDELRLLHYNVRSSALDESHVQ